MNTQQVSVIDPVLTELVRGPGDPQFVGHHLFPSVPVDHRTGTVIEFGDEEYEEHETRRAPGADIEDVEFGYEGATFKLYQDALNAKVPIEHQEEASKVPGIDLLSESVEGVKSIIDRRLEIDQATLARNEANYDSDHKIDLTASNWADDSVNPSVSIKLGIQSIRDYTGVEPNVFVLASSGFDAAADNPYVKERFKYTSSDSLTPEMLAKYLGIEKVVIAKSVKKDKQTRIMMPIWGDDGVLAFAPEKPKSRRQPSFGYTYVLKGTPYVGKPRFDENVRSWKSTVIRERKPVIAGATSAYLLKNISGGQ